ncbi:hypothetical protein DRQ18_03245 [bacterium]|nr:MAG: hypothetical protein DRQ18_03245 [bacterium]
MPRVKDFYDWKYPPEFIQFFKQWSDPDSRQVLRETRLELRASYENFELTGNLKHTRSFSPDYSTLEAKAGVRIRF